MSNNLSLAELEKTIKKVNDMVDIQLQNFNESFMIDNFEKKNILRNTILRSEFNSLCKGKTEAKNIGDICYENDKKIYLCKADQIRDIPPILKSLFVNPRKYYIKGTPSNSSFLYSLVSILDSNFILQGDAQREHQIDELRNTLVYNLDTFYTQNNYKQKRFKKNVIRDSILNSKVLPQVIHYILDYHNICLLIIDTETYLYTLGNDFSSEREYIMMIRKNNYYQPILNSEGKTRFCYDIINRASKILKPEFEIDMTIKSDIGIVDSLNITQLKSAEDKLPKPIKPSINLAKESSYKIGELQDLAIKIGIGIKKANTNRNKKKADLYEEIRSNL